MTTYMVGPTLEMRGRCRICGCRLQDPQVETGSIWLTPWHDCGGDCTVCMAHAGDPDAIAALDHWLALTKAGVGHE